MKKRFIKSTHSGLTAVLKDARFLKVSAPLRFETYRDRVKRRYGIGVSTPELSPEQQCRLQDYCRNRLLDFMMTVDAENPQNMLVLIFKAVSNWTPRILASCK